MIQELNQRAIVGVAGALSGITSELPAAFGLEEQCLYTIILPGTCDYMTCAPKFWVY